MDHLRNFLDGFAQCILWGQPQRAYRLPRNGFQGDREKLRNDAYRVGQTLSKVTKRHVKVSQG